MTQQTQQPVNAAPAIVPLRTLAELGDEGKRGGLEMDLTPRSPFLVDPGWYERYWYGDRSPSRWGVLANALCRLSSVLPRVGHIICRATAHTTSILVRLGGTTSKVRTSGIG